MIDTEQLHVMDYVPSGPGGLVARKRSLNIY